MSVSSPGGTAAVRLCLYCGSTGGDGATDQAPRGLCKYTPKRIDPKLTVQRKEQNRWKNVVASLPSRGLLPLASLPSQRGVSQNHPRLRCPSPPTRCPVSGMASVSPRRTYTSLPRCRSCKVTYPQQSYAEASRHLLRLTRARRDPRPLSAHPLGRSSEPPAHLLCRHLLLDRAGSCNQCWLGLVLSSHLHRFSLSLCCFHPFWSCSSTGCRLLCSQRGVLAVSVDVAAAAVVANAYLLMGLKPRIQPTEVLNLACLENLKPIRSRKCLIQLQLKVTSCPASLSLKTKQTKNAGRSYDYSRKALLSLRRR